LPIVSSLPIAEEFQVHPGNVSIRQFAVCYREKIAHGVALKVQFDRETDAVYLRLSDAEVVESEEVHSGVILDFDKDDRVVAIEVLRVQQRLDPTSLDHIEVEVA
jgi:uncharacterized protein YuzE